MANNVPITNGQGQSSVAAEEIAGAKYQQIKVVDGTTSSTNKWVINSDGSAQVSVVGTVSATISGSPSISGAVELVSTNASIITVWKDSSVIAIATGSVVALPTGNQSVSGIVGASVIGNVNTTITSIATAGGAIPVTFSAAANQSVSGTVGASVIGWVPIQPSNTSVITVLKNSSIIAVATGSVIAVPTGSVVTVWKDSSVLSVPTGSVITVWGKSPSIVGTFAEDDQHNHGEKGLFVVGVRNDSLASVQSSDESYQQFSLGGAGEQIVSEAPLTNYIIGTADLRVVQGGSVIAIAAQGSTVRTFIRRVQVSNFGPSSVLVKIADNTTSTLGWTIAPAGGGSNYDCYYKSAANSPITASINGTASVLVSMQGFTAKV